LLLSCVTVYVCVIAALRGRLVVCCIYRM